MRFNLTPDTRNGVNSIKKENREFKSDTKKPDTPHQETPVLKANDPAKTPNAAGLKTCLFFNLIRNFEAMAIIPIPPVTYHGRLGELTSAIITPETHAANGTTNGRFAIFLMRISLNTVEITATRIWCTLRSFCKNTNPVRYIAKSNKNN